MSNHQSIIELKQLIQSEIGDFFAGFDQVGEPATPEEMQTKLHANIDRCFAEVSKTETEQEGFSRGAGQALSTLTIGSLDSIQQYVDHRSNEIKSSLQELDAHLEVVDFSKYEALQKEASNLDNLSMVLSREVERVVGL
nr:hypothetical protein [uncultured Shewanella sp.]